MIKVLFVCLGNICRSPTAHGVFADLVKRAGLAESISVDSAGTSDWHIGSPPDSRSIAFAKKRAIDLSNLSARQVCKDDFESFDYILAMDFENLRHLKKLAADNYRGKLGLFLQYANNAGGLQEVPDPYYDGDAGFEQVLDLVEDASEQLLHEIQERLKLDVRL